MLRLCPSMLMQCEQDRKGDGNEWDNVHRKQNKQNSWDVVLLTKRRRTYLTYLTYFIKTFFFIPLSFKFNVSTDRLWLKH